VLAGFFLPRFHAFITQHTQATKLLIAAQWALTGFGLFCLVDGPHARCMTHVSALTSILKLLAPSS
jgi:hypothetical protein